MALDDGSSDYSYCTSDVVVPCWSASIHSGYCDNGDEELRNLVTSPNLDSTIITTTDNALSIWTDSDRMNEI